MLTKLKEEGKLHDQFYLNYNVENIDFESILISSFINYSLGHFSGTDVNKMGVTISELKLFFDGFFDKVKNEYVLRGLEDSKLKHITDKFVVQFGFDIIDDFEFYLHGVLSEHLSGYDYDSLADEDYQHIGGPILLNTLVSN